MVAAYRDLWQIDSDSSVGVASDYDTKRIDEARAREAVPRAADISEEVGERRRSGLMVERLALA